MLKKNCSLLPYNTFGMDVKCAYFFEYESEKELCDFLQTDIFVTNKHICLGGGSNMLFLNDYDGVVLHSQIKGIFVEKETTDEVFVRAGAGVVWDDFVSFVVDKNFFGAENLSLIPGTVGASVVQNIGAYGVEAKDIVAEVETVEISSQKKRIFTCAECEFAYRKSIFKTSLANKYIVMSVLYRLHKKPSFNLNYGNISASMQTKELTLKNVRETIVEVRRAKLPDPKEFGNAGSFFMNPVVSKNVFENVRKEYPQVPFFALADEKVKIPAAWLIEQCGWKENPSQHVAVWKNQPLVMINKGGAKPLEILDFSNKIINSVKEKFNIEISPEVIIVKS